MSFVLGSTIVSSLTTLGRFFSDPFSSIMISNVCRHDRQRKSNEMPTSVARMNPKTLPDAGKVGYSQISIAQPGRLAFVSGQVAWCPEGGAVPGSLVEQTAIVVKNLKGALHALEATPDDIVQMRIYLTDLRSETQEIAMTEIMRFLDGVQPSLTGIGVAALAAPDLQIEIEMIVRIPD